jgi:class 3 adenylate cyclase
MRTTLTLDPDVAARLESLQRERGVPFKVIVNDTLREGLKQFQQASPRRKVFRTPTVSLGRCLIGNLDDVAEVLAVAEGERLK